MLWVSSKNDSYLCITTRWYRSCYLTFSKDRLCRSDSTKLGESDTRHPSLCNKFHVSRWNRSLVSVRVMLVWAASIQQYRRIEKRLRREENWTSTPTNSFVFYLRYHLRMNLAHDATIGEHPMGNKKFPTHTQYLSIVMIIYERGEWIYIPL